MKIKDISKSNLPRGRFIKNGIGVLSDAELLAIVIGRGNYTENAIDLSNRVLKSYNIEKILTIIIGKNGFSLKEKNLL